MWASEYPCFWKFVCLDAATGLLLVPLTEVVLAELFGEQSDDAFLRLVFGARDFRRAWRFSLGLRA